MLPQRELSFSTECEENEEEESLETQTYNTENVSPRALHVTVDHLISGDYAWYSVVQQGAVSYTDGCSVSSTRLPPQKVTVPVQCIPVSYSKRRQVIFSTTMKQPTDGCSTASTFKQHESNSSVSRVTRDYFQVDRQKRGPAGLLPTDFYQQLPTAANEVKRFQSSLSGSKHT